MALDTTITADELLRHARRNERYAGLFWLWHHPQWDRAAGVREYIDSHGDTKTVGRTFTAVSKCHRFLRSDTAKIVVGRLPDGSVASGVEGVVSCGSVWVCPVCSEKVAAQRALDIATAIAVWKHRGGRVAMATLTQESTRDLRAMWDAQSKCWTRVTNGHDWIDDQDAFGSCLLAGAPDHECEAPVFTETIGKRGKPLKGSRRQIGGCRRRIGWIRAVEATVGPRGWHLHIHAVFFLRGDLDLKAFGSRIFERWSGGLAQRGIKAHRRGFDLRWIEDKTDADGNMVSTSSSAMSSYFTKMTYTAAQSAGFEIARGGQKKARASDNRSPFQVLADLVSTDETWAMWERDLMTWFEWERVSKGRRQITWSRGLRDALLDDSERTDEEIAESSPEVADKAIMHIMSIT